MSISIFIASLTTTYFSEKIIIIFFINIISIALLIIFIIRRNKILSEIQTTLLGILKESDIIICEDIILKLSDFNKRLKELKKQRNSIKIQQK